MQIPPFSTPGRFWRGNLHTHSHRSDGALAPEQVVDAYKRAGYDFVATLRPFPRTLRLADHRHARVSLQRFHDADRRRAARDGHRGRRALAHSRGRPAARFPAAAIRRNRARSSPRGARRRRLRRHRASRVVAAHGRRRPRARRRPRRRNLQPRLRGRDRPRRRLLSARRALQRGPPADRHRHRRRAFPQRRLRRLRRLRRGQGGERSIRRRCSRR